MLQLDYVTNPGGFEYLMAGGSSTLCKATFCLMCICMCLRKCYTVSVTCQHVSTI